MVTEMVASEIRSVTRGGVALAENKRLVVRSPMVLGVVCASSAGPTTTVHLDGGDAGVTAADVAGVAQRNALTVMTLGSTAQFRGPYLGTLVEFATGMDATAQFQYRTTTATYTNSVLPLALANVVAIRIHAMARRKPPTGGVADVTAGWSVNVFLRNIR